MKTVNQIVILKRSWKVRQMCEESKWLLINSALRSWVKTSPLCSAFGEGACFHSEHSEKTKKKDAEDCRRKSMGRGLKESKTNICSNSYQSSFLGDGLDTVEIQWGFSKYTVTNVWPGWQKQYCMGQGVQKPHYTFTKGEKTPARLPS